MILIEVESLTNLKQCMFLKMRDSGTIYFGYEKKQILIVL